MGRRNNIKTRIMVYLMLAIMIITSLPVPTVNASIIGNENSGGGTTGGSGTSGGGWAQPKMTQAKTGYRFYIVNSNFKRVSGVLDITYEQPMVNSNKTFTNGVGENLSSSKNNYYHTTFKHLTNNGILKSNNIPTNPMTEVGDVYHYKGNGDKFRQWMLDGLGGTDLISSGSSSSFINSSVRKPTTSTGSQQTVRATSRSTTNYTIPKQTGGSSNQAVKGSYAGRTFYSDGSIGGRFPSAKEIFGTSSSKIQFKSAASATGAKAADNFYTYATALNKLYNDALKSNWTVYVPTSSGGLNVSTKNNTSAAMLYVYSHGITKIRNSMPRSMTDAEKLLTIIKAVDVSRLSTYQSALKSAQNFLRDTTKRRPGNDIQIDRLAKNSDIIEDNIQLAYQENEINLSQSIPLSNGGYVHKILNLKKPNGEYALQYLSGEKIVNGNNPQIMGRNDYRLVVEPVMWFEPHVRPPSNRTEGYFIYGTMRNITDYITNNLKYTGSGYNNWRYTNAVGWECLKVTQDIEFDTFKIVAPTSSGRISFQTIKNKGMTVSGGKLEGMALHIYRSEPNDDWTKTRDDGPDIGKGEPHKAPSKSAEPQIPVRIVKVYEHKDGKIETYSNNNNVPNRIYILNEKPTWKVTEWFTGKSMAGITKTTKWSDIKGNSVYNSRVQKGTTVPSDNFKDNSDNEPDNPGGKVVELGGSSNENTLYVRYTQNDDTTNNPSSANVRITESQISNVANSPANGASTNPLKGNHPGILLGRSDAEKKHGNKYYYTVFRGADQLTVAEFSGIAQSAAGNQVKTYSPGYMYGDTSGEGRAAASYEAGYSLNLNGTLYNNKAFIDVFKGTPSGGTVDTSVPAVTYPNQARVPTGINISFNPFIWMTKANIGNNGTVTRDRVNILGEYVRSLVPNDYAEITVSPGKLQMQSNMWAVDQKIIQEKGPGTTLKGGATYSLTTPQHGRVTVNTYQTIVEGIQADSVTLNGTATRTEAIASHNDLLDIVSGNLQSNLQIKQYVNKNGSDNVINGGIAVSPGSNIGSLGNGSTFASTDAKYYLRDDVDSTQSNSLALDVTEGDSVATYYGFFSLPNGNIYMTSSSNYNTVQNRIKNAVENHGTGSSLNNTSIALTKGGNTVNGTAAYINQKTGIVTKMAKALERNKGNDNNADWVSDGKWYNEGCLGVTVMHIRTNFSVGFAPLTNRMAILDPRLTPKQKFKGDMNTKFFSSQYVVEDVGGNGNIQGEFKGKPLKINFNNILQPTDVWYIPNSTVTDNQ